MTKYEVLQNLENAAVQTLNKGVVRNNVKQFKDYIGTLRAKRLTLTLEEGAQLATDDWVEGLQF